MQVFIDVDHESVGVALNQLVSALNAEHKYLALSGNTPLTLTGANLAGARNVVLELTAALGGAGTLNLPTVANTLLAATDWAVGESRRFRIINSSSGNFAWTVTTATGWTLAGTMSIAQNTWRDFVATYTAAGAITLQQVGTGTNS